MAFAQNTIDQIRQIPLADIVGNQVEDYSKQWWFAYFWQEAAPKNQLFDAQWAAIVPFFNEMFDGNQWPGNLVQVTDWNAMQDDTVLNAMLGLMVAGFIITPSAGAAVLPANATQEDEDVAARVRQVDGVKWGWRGDSRSFAQIDAAGGLINKVESEAGGFAESIGAREAWNPFSSEVFRREYTYRRSSEDNGLQATVSMTPNAKTGALFPLVSVGDFPVPALDQLGPTVLAPAVRRRYGLVDVTVGGQPRTVARIVDTIRLYLSLIEGRFLDTQAVQQLLNATPFPEFAVKAVPSPNVLASASFVRVHHATTFNEFAQGVGTTILFKPSGSVAPSRDRCLAQTGESDAADILLGEAMGAYKEALSLDGTSIQWQEDGPANGAPFTDNGQAVQKVNRVSDVFGQQLWP